MKFKNVKIEKNGDSHSQNFSIEFEYDEEELEFSVLKDLCKYASENNLDFEKDVGKFVVSTWIYDEECVKDVKKAISNILDSSTFAMVYIHNEEEILNFLASFRVKNNELFQSVE